MDKEFIQKVHDANAIINKAKSQIVTFVVDYFKNNPNPSYNMPRITREEDWYDYSDSERITFNLKFGELDVDVVFEVYADHTATCMVDVLTLNFLDIPIKLKNNISVDMFYEGNFIRKKFIKYENLPE